MRFPNKRVQVKTVPAKPLTDTELQAMYDYVRKIPNEEVLRTLYTTIANNAGGVQNMDPELALAFADSFAKFQKNIPESVRRPTTIRLTENRLRKIIRRIIKEV